MTSGPRGFPVLDRVVDDIDQPVLFSADGVPERIRERPALPEDVFGTALRPDMKADVRLTVFRIIDDLETRLAFEREVAPRQVDRLLDLAFDAVPEAEHADLARDLRTVDRLRRGVGGPGHGSRSRAAAARPIR